MSMLWKTASELQTRREPFVVVTMVSVRGSAPQDPGAKAIVTQDGLYWGTVGGGKVEARAILHAKEILGRTEPSTGAPELVTWNLQRDIGMTCGGEATYLFETHRSDGWRIVIYGAGHVAQAVVRALDPLNCSITCIDHRSEWVDRLPSSGRVERRCVPKPEDTVREFDASTFFVSMTQGHAMDVPVLTEIFKLFPDAPYIGVIGSAVKGIKIRKELVERGVSTDLLARLRCPVGLPIGGNDPAEIAISLIAELIQVRDSTQKES